MSAAQQVLATARAHHREHQLDEALVLYRSLYELDRRSPELLYLIGLAHYQKQEFKLAERFLRKAAAAAPAHCESHCVLGQALLRRGRISAARRCFDTARSVDAANLAAINGGVIACYLLGEFAAAQKRLHESVAKNGSEADAWFNLSRTFEDIFPIAVPLLDPRTPRFVLVNLLYNDETFRAAADAILDAAPDTPAASPRDGRCQALFRHALLNHVLETILVPHADFERLLVRLRRMLLEFRLQAGPGEPAPQGVWPFAARLAEYFWQTEYLPEQTEAERQGVAALKQRLSGGREDYPDRLLIAAYEAPDPQALAGAHAPACMDALIARAAERAEERRIAESLPALTAIEEPVSVRVREQYETFPYPRWRAPAATAAKISFGEAVRGARPDAALADFLFEPVSMLVAGCGTGQEPINHARSYHIRRLLALDLSRTSLAYAARKARTLGLDWIEFAQADLLALPAPAEPFDVICSSGVLHHLADPLRGWSALRGMLRPGGIMLIALYSRAARRLITRGRELAAAAGLSGRLDDMRALRRTILEQPAHELRPLIHWSDFYSSSMLRDLLFHEQEHQFDVAQIDACVRRLDLEFLGFSGLTLEARRRFGEVHGSEAGSTELARWEAVEQACPDTFTGMYQLILRG